MANLLKIALDVIRDYKGIAAKYMVESRIAGGGLWRAEEKEGGYGPVTRDRMLHAMKIFDKPWFGRVWAFQEVGLSRDALVAYSGLIINLTEIMAFVWVWARGEIPFPGVGFNSSAITGFSDEIWATYAASIDQCWYRSFFNLTTAARYGRRSTSQEFFDVLLGEKRGQKASDPRDFVYAFLGYPLARSEDGELLVKADYTITISELRLRLFSRLSERSLRFLGLTWHKFLTDLSEAPSWYPLLDCARHWTINSGYDASRGEHLLNPAGKHRTRVNGPCLETSVYVVDTVLRCGEVAGGLPSQKDGDQAQDDESHYLVLKTMLTGQPSLAEEYWAILEATESINGLAYLNKALAFASTLMQSCDRDDNDYPAIAKSFGNFCREHSGTRFIPCLERMASGIKGERFFTTIKGYCGTSTPLVEPGDLICIVPSVQTPLVIRPVEGKDKTVRIIGSSYVWGMMYGEIFKNTEPGHSPPQALIAQFL